VSLVWSVFMVTSHSTRPTLAETSAVSSTL
ncbi:hypothetical protein M513_09130, partial [Trichuris suis]